MSKEKLEDIAAAVRAGLKGRADATIPIADVEKMIRQQIVAVPWRVLGLAKRLPELFASRQWPLDDDLMAVCGAAIGYETAGIHQMFKRPAAAAELREGIGVGDFLWPEGLPLSALEIIHRLGLKELLAPR